MNFTTVKMLVGCTAVVAGSVLGITSTASQSVLWGTSTNIIWSVALIVGGMLDLLTSRRVRA